MTIPKQVGLRSRLSAAWSHWSAEPDPYIRFSILLYCFTFAAVVTIIAEPPVQKTQVLGTSGGPLGYLTWEVLGVAAPVLYLGQWLLRLYGRRYLGMSLRLIADILEATVIFMVWTARAQADFPLADVNVFSNYVFMAVGLFALALLARDVWVLFFRKGP